MHPHGKYPNVYKFPGFSGNGYACVNSSSRTIFPSLKCPRNKAKLSGVLEPQLLNHLVHNHGHVGQDKNLADHIE